jgi:hypothetical protein
MDLLGDSAQEGIFGGVSGVAGSEGGEEADDQRMVQ